MSNQGSNSQLRIGFRVFSNSAWMGGVNYVVGLARMLRCLPLAERPLTVFLVDSPDAHEIAVANADLVDGIEDFAGAAELDLDFVFPATQIAEAPFEVPWAGWIPDWQCQHYPELFSDAERKRRMIQYGILARDPVCCVFSSEQARLDTRRLFPASTVSMEVLHFPANLPDQAFLADERRISQLRTRLGIPERYLIVCNQFWRHKNHRLILSALAQVPELDVHVVMTGEFDDERWPEYADELRQLMTNRTVADRTTLTGRIDRQDQLALLCGASGYIQPSLFEGWSSFVEEARALGIPGLLSDIPVHREQDPWGSSFFDPLDAQGFAEVLQRWCADPPARKSREVAWREYQAQSLEGARNLVRIALATKSQWGEQSETKAILLRRLAELANDESIRRSDFDAFCAGVRQLFRAHPEQLASFASLATLSDVRDEVERTIVRATLAKMSANAQEVYRMHARGDASTGKASAWEWSGVTAWGKLAGARIVRKLRSAIGGV